MKYRKLGYTDLNTSVIGLGTFQFGGEWGKQFVQKEIDLIAAAAADRGINFIDTAECYGDHQVESLIGKAISNNREHWIVATKFGHKYNGFMDRSSDWSPEGVTKQLEESLKALKTDHIDLYQFHSGGNEYFDQDELWKVLNKHVNSGKIRFLGISMQHSAVMNDDLYQVKSAKKVNASIVQVVYNRLSRDAERLLLPYCEKNRLGVIARIPLARGFLSGKYSNKSYFASNDLRSKQDKEDRLRMIKEVEEIKKNELPKNINMVQYALKWILKHSAINSCVVGCKDVKQLIENSLEGTDLE